MQHVTEFLRRYRNFLTHPQPDRFAGLVDEIFTKHEWGFPQSVARDVIKFFFEEKKIPFPDWLHESTRLFRVPRIEVFDPADG